MSNILLNISSNNRCKGNNPIYHIPNESRNRRLKERLFVTSIGHISNVLMTWPCGPFKREAVNPSFRRHEFKVRVVLNIEGGNIDVFTALHDYTLTTIVFKWSLKSSKWWVYSFILLFPFSRCNLHLKCQSWEGVSRNVVTSCLSRIRNFSGFMDSFRRKCPCIFYLHSKNDLLCLFFPIIDHCVKFLHENKIIYK